MKRTSLGLSLLILLVASPSAALGLEPLRAADLELIVVAGSRVARVRVEASVDRTPVRTLWDETFTTFFRAADHDNDGSLNAIESEWLPGPFALRQGPPYLNPGYPVSWTELDGNHDGKASFDELTKAYRRHGLGGVLVGTGRASSAPALTAALLRQLDANGDGRFDEPEANGARARLLELDTDADELLEPAELVPHTRYPGTTSANFLMPPNGEAPNDAPGSATPIIVLPLTSDVAWAGRLHARLDADGDRRLDHRESGLTTAIFDALDRSHDGYLVSDELSLWPTLPPDARWDARIEEVSESAPLEVMVGDIKLVLRVAPGSLPDTLAAAAKRLRTQFSEADTNRNHRIDADESAAPNTTELRRAVAPADRDGDQVLSADELDAWLALQEQVVRGHTTLSLVDHGRGLFELLDADHDGALSAREIGAARARMKAAGVVTDNSLVNAEALPHTLVGTLSRGRPRAAYQPLRAGPPWFRAMDRNRDGDVSRREFIGSAVAFDRLDSDHDGLLSDREAATAGTAARPR